MFKIISLCQILITIIPTFLILLGAFFAKVSEPAAQTLMGIGGFIILTFGFTNCLVYFVLSCLIVSGKVEIVSVKKC